MITTRIAKILMKMIKSSGHLVHKSTEEHIISTTENLHICTIFPNLDHWYRHNANQIYMGYIYLLSRPLVYYCLQLFTLYSTLTLISYRVPMYKIPPTQPTSCQPKGPTYLNTVSADIGVDLAGRNPDGFAGIQSLRAYRVLRLFRGLQDPCCQ